MRNKIINAYDAGERLALHIGNQQPCEDYYLLQVANNFRILRIDILTRHDEEFKLSSLMNIIRVYPSYVVLARNSWYLTPNKQDELILRELKDELEPKYEVADCLVFNQKSYMSYREDYLMDAPAIPYIYKPKRMKEIMQ